MTALPKGISRNLKFQTLFEDRERSAKEARDAQKSYLRWQRALILATVGASVTGGVLLYVADLDPALANQLSFLSLVWVQSLLVVCQATCIGIAASAVFIQTPRGFNERWQTARVRSEELRWRIQRSVLELGLQANDADLKTVGAYFLSFVRGQQAYHRNRAEKAQKRAGSMLLFGAIVVGIAAGTGALASIGAPVLLVIIGLIGVVSPALLAAFKSWEEVNRSNDREKLHKQTATLLTEALADWDQFDGALGKRDTDAVMAFADRVFQVLETDLKGFVEITSEKES